MLNKFRDLPYGLKPLPERWLMHLYRKVFGRKIFSSWNRLLMELAYRGLGIRNDEDIYASGESKYLRRVFAGAGQVVIIDVGANKGHYSDLIKRLNPEAQVLAVEPNPGIYKRLQAQAKIYHYETLNAGLSSSNGKMNLYDFPGAGDGTVYASPHQEAFEKIYGQSAVATPVKAFTIDQLIHDHNLGHIDLLKIDAEGHEFEIIKGAERAIASGMIDRVQFEFDEINVYLKTCVFEFEEKLPGYDFYRILPSGELLPLSGIAPQDKEIFSFQNIIALRKGI